MLSIAQLIQAAEFLERREREAEHGYASTLPMPDESKRNRSKPKKSQGNRSTHNELEKNRRAHLRNCLEKLKDMVPLGRESSRHTTLGLLTEAKSFIKNLEEKERKQAFAKEDLKREHRYLQRKLERLSQGQYRTQERSISECSTSTNSNSASESDEVDIIGFNSAHSDTDDHSSIQSVGSDGGCSVDTKRLSFVTIPASL
ncbi:max-interacting protein 1-like [Liolophura sinensis]|uniref:max-interacting protein 1-like n=1 Tax=Liolophura sinensis TaxID=3198878 RepID=UPI003158EEB5